MPYKLYPAGQYSGAGTDTDGFPVGICEDGKKLGLSVGDLVGCTVSPDLVGEGVGAFVGSAVGCAVGLTVTGNVSQRYENF